MTRNKGPSPTDTGLRRHGGPFTATVSMCPPGGGSKPLRVLVADDHDLVRRGVRALLESHSEWSICAEACTGRDAVSKSSELKPDIVILDIAMPELNGVEAARKIHKASPGTEILALSVHYSDQLAREILDAGIHGYIVKSDSEGDLVAAVEALARHKPFFHVPRRGSHLEEPW
jgi:DNA-binding NarL/FixJ family response regulator